MQDADLTAIIAALEFMRSYDSGAPQPEGAVVRCVLFARHLRELSRLSEPELERLL